MAFGLNFFTVAPGFRVAGDSLAYAYKFVKRGGQADGTAGLEIGLTDDPTIKLLEASVSGFEEVIDSAAVYTTLVSGGLKEVIPGLALGIDSLSSIEVSATTIKFALAGAQPAITFNSSNVPAVAKVGDSGYVWDLPPATFATLKTTAETYQSDLKIKVTEMIAARVAADDTLTAAVAAQSVVDVAARVAIQADIDQNETAAAAAVTAETTRVNALIASGMWLYPDQAAFPAAADNHGRVVHSHADGSMFYAHGGTWNKLESETEATAARLVIQNDVDQNESDADAAIAAEATTRGTADTALSGRLDTLEADPTTAAALAAGDAATLSSANTYTDTAVSNVIGTAPGVLDTLGEIADAINDDANAYTTLVAQIATVQTDVDGNETDSDAAEAALSARITTLEADPTTATALAAVQTDVDANEAASDAAESALSGRLNTLEADPTTATAVAAVQSDVNQNETDADAADAALSGRLDVLEADPTTATAVAAVQTDVDSIEAAASTARTALQTALQNAIDAVQANVNTNESDADTAIATKLNLAGGTLTGNLVVNRDFPDVELKSNGEKRVLFTDAGGGATGAIKNTSSSLDLYAGGIASGNLEMSVTTSGVDVSALKIGGAAVTASVTELNYVDGVTSAIQTQLNAIQADVDTNESDADTAIALRAPIDAPTFTGVPAAPTASAATNTTQLATTAFVTTAVAALDAAALRTLLGIVSAANDAGSGLASGQMYFNTGSSKYVLVA